MRWVGVVRLRRVGEVRRMGEVKWMDEVHGGKVNGAFEEDE